MKWTMEQHPVPQNVTTFQFRLIGDMTIKQFGYLAGGAIMAYIMYKLPLPFFFTWPLAVISAVGGFGLAFVPIEERPMDVWVLSFFKSIYNPTQYIWSRKPAAPTGQQQPPIQTPAAPTALPQQTNPNPTSRKGDILNNIFFPAAAPPAGGSPARKGIFDWFFDLWTPKPKTVSPVLTQTTMAARAMDFSLPPAVKPATKDVAQALADTQQKESALEDKLKKLSSELEEKNAAQSRIAELQAQLTELMSEREKMSQELANLRKQSSAVPAPVASKTTTTTTQTPKVPTIQIIAPGRAVKAGLPRLTTFPNIVTGIVKDKEKNLLPGVLVTVKDKEGVPLRALKTNRLGQFAASTPLPNGTYLVEIEDPRLRYTFDRAQVTLNGTIVPALEIFAKTEKEITRAKLEKELFGNQT